MWVLRRAIFHASCEAQESSAQLLLARVPAVCNFVHGHFRFDYFQARSTPDST